MKGTLKLQDFLQIDCFYLLLLIYYYMENKFFVYSDKMDETPQLIGKARQGYAN